MSSSAKHGRLVRSVRDETDVVVLGAGRSHPQLPPAGALSTVADLLAAAERRAAEIVAEAEARAAACIAEAQAGAGAIRDTSYAEGLDRARAEVQAQFAGHIDVARRAAEEGKSIRDSIAAQSSAVVARATAIATRRLVGEYYEADPDRTAAACADALRAAAGQEVLALRVNPAVAGHVQATLIDAARYIQPDDAVAVGGCLVDLQHGTIDASLDTRLALLDLALEQAGGDVVR